jgi:hypothetical protein
LSPKVLEQYQDPIAATKDPELALITFNWLWSHVQPYLMLLKRAMLMPLFMNCLNRRRLDICLAHNGRGHGGWWLHWIFFKLAEESLKTLFKDSTISVILLHSKRHHIFALYKAGIGSFTKAKMQMMCCKMKMDPDYAFAVCHYIC